MSYRHNKFFMNAFFRKWKLIQQWPNVECEKWIPLMRLIHCDSEHTVEPVRVNTNMSIDLVKWNAFNPVYISWIVPPAFPLLIEQLSSTLYETLLKRLPILAYCFRNGSGDYTRLIYHCKAKNLTFILRIAQHCLILGDVEQSLREFTKLLRPRHKETSHQNIVIPTSLRSESFDLERLYEKQCSIIFNSRYNNHEHAHIAEDMKLRVYMISCKIPVIDCSTKFMRFNFLKA